MARSWTTLGKQIGWMGPRLVFSGGIKMVAQLQQSGMLPRSVGTLVTEVLSPVVDPGRRGRRNARTPAPGLPGRPVASVLRPTAGHARQVVYSPDLAGPARPGEVVWTWARLGDEPGRDLPVLVIGRDDSILLGLELTGDPARIRDDDWVAVGAATWNGAEHPTWARVDRVLDVPEASIRREGAVLDRPTFDLVAHRLCTTYRWR